MVFQEESIATRWWSFIGRSPRGGVDKDTQPEEIDALSLAEKGLAHECSENFLQPENLSGKLSRFTVRRSRNRTQYRLFRDSGEFAMYAEVRFLAKEVCFFMYDPDDKENGLYDPDRPAFRMEFDESRTAWVMSHFLDGAWSSPRRQSCQGSRRQEEVLFVEHSKEKIGDGINYALSAEFKSKCSEPALKCQTNGDAMQKLETRPAVWNEELQTLVLDFRDREIVPSAKNFQVVRECSPQRVVCQHGKICSNTFALDFRAPLSIAQAFAMSVTTLFWE
jgi:hypothetical protein